MKQFTYREKSTGSASAWTQSIEGKTVYGVLNRKKLFNVRFRCIAILLGLRIESGPLEQPHLSSCAAAAHGKTRGLPEEATASTETCGERL